MTDASTRTIALDELRQHASEKSCWILLHGKVYDVTDFLEEHPGGYDIIVAVTGKDASQDFDDIGHSNSAKALLKKYLIGSFEGGSPIPPAAAPPVKAAATSSATREGPSALARTINVLIPILLLLLAVGLKYLYGKKAQS